MGSLSKNITLLLLLSMLLLTVFLAPVRADLSWNIQTIDADADSNSSLFCHIAVDSNNNPQIVYSTGYPDQILNNTHPIIYASWNGSNWNSQIIGDHYVYALVLDSNNNAHVLYSGIAGLTYVSWTGTQWVTQGIDRMFGGVASLALDSSGNPHVAYYGANSLKYASSKGSSWDIQTVDSEGTSASTSGYTYLAFDSHDSPYILYNVYENNSYTPKLATESHSGWSTQTLPNLGGVASLVLDSRGFPHFICSHKDSTQNSRDVVSLLYVSWDGSAWNTQTVDSNLTMPGVGHLVLDSHDYPHIAYIVSRATSAGVDSLKYASWTGRAWDVQTVSTGNLGVSRDLALDSNGKPHLVFAARPSQSTSIFNVNYATVSESAPTSEPTTTSTQTLTPSQTPTPHSPPLTYLLTDFIVVAIVSLSVGVGVGLIVYFKKRKC